MNAAVIRHTSSEWDQMTDVRLSYDLVWSLILLIMLFSAYGLFRYRKWGFALALVINAIMSFALLGIAIMSIFLLESLNYSEIFSIHAFNIIIGSISFCFFLYQLCSNKRVVNI